VITTLKFSGVLGMVIKSKICPEMHAVTKMADLTKLC